MPFSLSMNESGVIGVHLMKAQRMDSSVETIRRSGKTGKFQIRMPGWLGGVLAISMRRLAFGVLILMFIIFLSYLGLDMATGAKIGPATYQALGDTAAYLGNLLQGEMGTTTLGGETIRPRLVTEMIVERVPRSLGLVGASLAFASLVGLCLGIWAARSSSRGSLGILTATLLGVSVPSFFIAFLLQWSVIMLTQKTGRTLLPVGGFGWNERMLLPMLVLAARPIAQITRITFSTIRNNYEQDYVRTASGKGLAGRRILSVHVLRNAAIPILAVIGISLVFILSSLPVVELYFGWSGAGLTLLKSIARQDTNATVSLALCLGLLFIFINLLLDLSYRLIDPRLAITPEHVAHVERRGILKNLRGIWEGLRDLIRENPLSRWTKRQSAPTLPSLMIEPASQVRADELKAEDRRHMRGAWRSVLHNSPLMVGGLLVVGLLVVIVFGPQMAPNNPFQTRGLVSIDGKLTVPPFPPSEQFPWGTDLLGRDLLSLILAGAQQTLTLAILAVVARMVVGVSLGALAGWRSNSLLDRSIVGLAGIISAFPTLLVVMILILALGIRQGMPPFILALCFVGWGEIMQYVRAEVIGIRTRPYIESAVASGARSGRILRKHVLPVLFAGLVSIAALEMGSVLMLLGELGFISIFIGGGALIALPSATLLYSDVPEWGALLSNLRYQVRSYPWTGFYPMMAFFVAILSFNLLGEGLRRMVEEGNPLLHRLFNRYTMLVTLVVVLGYNWLSSNSGALPFYRQQARQFDGQHAFEHAQVLADERLQGRALGSDGIRMAAIYAAMKFDEYGLQPGGESASYFQRRKRSFEVLLSNPGLAIQDGGQQPVYGQDFAVYPGRNASIGSASGPLQHIGLGIDAAVKTPGLSYYYPELDRRNYEDQVLLCLSDREASFLANKDKLGMLVLAEDTSVFDRRYTLSGRTGRNYDFYTDIYTGEEEPSLWVSSELVERMLSPSETTLAELQQQSAERSLEQVFETPIDIQVSLDVQGKIVEDFPVENVIGLLPGTEGYDHCADCLGKQLIVVMAQYDSPPIAPEGIYPAANDNASGVAVLLETLRSMQASQYQPYKSMLFVVYSGEGLDNGEQIDPQDINKFLQANPSFKNFNLEAVVMLRGLGAGSGDGLQVSAQGSLRLAELFERAARQMGVTVVRARDEMDIGLIYDESNPLYKGGQQAPVISLSWQGWQEDARTARDTLDTLSIEKLEDSGRTLALALMILARETNY